MHTFIEALHRANQTALAIFVAARLPGDLTPRQYAVLAAVAADEGMDQTKLVSRTSIDRSTMTGIVRRLADRELIKRTRTEEDARAYSIIITPKGRELLSEATPLAEAAEQRLAEAIPSKERAAVLSGLGKLAVMQLSA